MGDLIRTSLEGIKDFCDVETVFGKAVTTPSGVTVIPVSKVSIGFATGGVDFQSKRPISPTNFGGGSGSGILITPVAFLTVGRDGDVNLINIGEKEISRTADHLFDIIENSPKIIEKIKNVLNG